MSITIDLSDKNTVTVKLQFTLPGGEVQARTFSISCKDDEAFAFEIRNDSSTNDPIWACTMEHPPPEEDAYIDLRITGPNDSNPDIPITTAPGMACAMPISDPPPDTWLWGGDTFHLYFHWTHEGGTTVPADNTGLAPGVQPGSPLLVTVLGASPDGKKVRVRYPQPGDTVTISKPLNQLETNS